MDSVTVLFGQNPALVLPASESFSQATFPSGWSQQQSASITISDWSVSSSSFAGGSASEMKATWVNAVGTSRLVTPPILTASVQAILLQFRHRMNDYSFGVSFRIQSSPDGINWQDQNWIRHSGSGIIGPEVTTALISGPLSDTTYIAFTIQGDHYRFFSWYIDDVAINSFSSVPGCSSVSSPGNGTSGISPNLTLSWSFNGEASDYLLYIGTNNPPDNLINGGSTGGGSTYTLNNLLVNTTFYWKVVPVNLFGQATNCPVWSFTTLSPLELPYSNSFTGSVLPAGWVTQETGTLPGWYMSPSSNAGGTAPELGFDFQFSMGTSRLITPPLGTSGLATLQLQFKNFYIDDYQGLILKIQSSSDGVNWTDEIFSHASGTGSLGPETVNTSVSHNLGGTTYLSFTLEGDHSAFYFWNIDDVVISAGDSLAGVITGTLRYDNNSQSKLGNVTVLLKNSLEQVTDSVLTDNDGFFGFSDVGSGDYHLEFICTKPWGGVNAIDALQIMKHFTGTVVLQGIRLMAADPDASGYVNSVDALLVMKRFVGLINSFSQGDWIFDASPVSISPGASVSISVKGLCNGDTDGSYYP